MKPGSTISYLLTAVFICGFCLAASPVPAPTTEDTRAKLEAEYKQHTERYQELTKEKNELSKEYYQRYGALTVEQEKEAAINGRIQRQLKKLDADAKDAVKDGKGKK